jgi:hypothetical protein
MKAVSWTPGARPVTGMIVMRRYATLSTPLYARCTPATHRAIRAKRSRYKRTGSATISVRLKHLLHVVAHVPQIQRRRPSLHDPTRRARRAPRGDATLRPEIQRIWDANQQVCGPRKVWKQLRREGCRVAPCAVVRLIRNMGLVGVVRGRAWITTTQAAESGRPREPCGLAVRAHAPNKLWVSDFTLRRHVGRVRLRRVRP